MSSRTIAGAVIDVDAEGFMTQSTQWTPEIAIALSNELGIAPLTDAHWRVLTFARDDTAKHGQSPGPRRIVAGAGVTMKELYALFPKGPGKLVARLAGVPKPKSCL